MLHGGDYNPDQWLDRPDILAEDIRMMKLAGINEATVGIFSWSRLEPVEGRFEFEWLDDTLNRLHAAGIQAVLATPSGARPAWMDEKYPEVRRVGPDRVHNLHGGRHNHCPSSPVYREKTRIMNRLLAERYKDHPAVVMWHVSNEYGGQCHCPLCQESFRDWLRRRYGNDIDKLNHAWWTDFWSHRFNSFEQIESPSPHGESSLHGLNLDWKRFTTWNTVQFYLNEVQPLRQVTPHIPVTTNMMGTYPGLDYRAFADHLDVVSWDSYPRWHAEDRKDWEIAADTAFAHDLMRSLKPGRSWMLMESTPSQVNWSPVNRPKRPGMHLLSSLQAVAHGSDTVQYFQYRKSRGSSEKLHGAVIDHAGHEHTRVFREVAQVGEALGRLSDVAGTHYPAQAAVLFDWENRWAIEDLQGINRNRKYEETCKAHHRALWKLGANIDVIGMDADFAPYRMLVAPMLYMLRPGVGARLAEFVRAGGTLVTTYLTGYADASDLCFLGGFPGEGLMDVVGIWAEEIDALYPGQTNGVVFVPNPLNLQGTFGAQDLCEIVHTRGAEVLAAYTDDYYEGLPAVTRNRYGDGLSYHIAARTDDDLLDELYGAILLEAGISFPVTGRLPKGVSATLRTDGESDFLFLMNFTRKTRTVPLPPASMTDLLTAEPISTEAVLSPYGVRVIRIDRVDTDAPNP
ncbi:MAG: beta-galactosidase [Clostridia bacterium]|nr:beta-galactosidase [Clostridia bacterium]